MVESAIPPAEGQTTAPQTQQQTVQVDDSGLQPMYTNFCRVTGTPEEIILDFGLNAEPFGRATVPIKISQRMVFNFFTAKRLLMALTVAVRRHEDTFGVLETDVNKRVRGNPGMTATGGNPAGGGPAPTAGDK